ncbi:putative Pectinesterase inhibitor [Melia azedarach]|uniref:Pectinesterase inhibitor n=1 Tax=Melia azedarach TaxID=155640 RepID=A0ACC1XWI2_MELAZ|nr:putative Pectinesterase inhibitor [Melia azedarach]
MASPIFFLLLLPILHQPFIFASADSNLIQKTCKNTKHYDLCVSSLKSNPTSTNVDTKGLAIIMIGVGLANATSTSSFLTSQLLTATNETVLKKLLKDCADKYTYAANSLQASAQDLGMENYDYAYMHISAASDYPNACRNAFRRSPGVDYPPELARREDGLKQICDVVLGIVDYLASTF